MNDIDIKAIAAQVAAVRQALQVTSAVAEDLREAIQPTLNQAAILFTEAVLAAKAHGEKGGLEPADALQVALASMTSIQGSAFAAAAQAAKGR